MGMVISFTTISDENADLVILDPPLIWKVVAPEDPDIYEKYRASSRQISSSRNSFLFNIFKKKVNVAPISATVVFNLDAEKGEGSYIDLDKSWHAIHYLLTGSAEDGEPPLNFIISGGKEVGNIDVGYGPARIMKSNEVRQVLNTISKISVETLISRYNPENLTKNKIYPEIWNRPDEESQNREYISENYAQMIAFFEQAVSTNLGLVITLS
jgi:hypothetical protein